jgi:hypothetical protein
MNINDTIIREATTGKKLRDCSIQDLHVPLTKCAALAGAKEAIPDPQFKMFQTVLAVGYPQLTLNELSIAVTMNITRQLEKHVQCFGEFTHDYLCSILSQYKDFRGKVMVRYHQEVEDQRTALALPPKQVTEADWLSIIEADKKSMAAGKDTWTFGAVRVFRWLQETGRVNDDDYTDEQIKEMRRRARYEVMTRENISPRKVSTMSEAELRIFEQKCVCELQTMAYFQYLKKL